MSIGAVIIGRNEGARLIKCLRSVGMSVNHIVYVDSGSNDGSVEAAQATGAEVVLLDTAQPFTAARARNAGLAALEAKQDPPDLVQFIDGDCELRAGWVDQAQAFLAKHPEVAVVCGRRRERFPEATRYNRLIDEEWNTPIGETRSCGGDALMRLSALQNVGGYNPSLVAGEEPELCVRLRQAGWKIWRLDAEMTWHDAALNRFSQWWTRARRAGHAYAEGAALHGAPPERHNVAQTRRALFWGAALPLVIVIGIFVTPWATLLVGLWGVKVLRLIQNKVDLERAIFLTLGNFPEALGVLSYYRNRLLGAETKLIEYK